MPLHNAAGRRRERAAGATHELTLHQSRINGSTGDVIEMRLRVEQQSLSRRKVRALQHGGDSLMEAGKNLVQRRGIKTFFIFEVVIEQGLVDSGSAGNFIGARSGNAFM